MKRADLQRYGYSVHALREAARKHGMRTLRESGLLAIYDGLTTIEEVAAQTIFEDSVA